MLYKIDRVGKILFKNAACPEGLKFYKPSQGFNKSLIRGIFHRIQFHVLPVTV